MNKARARTIIFPLAGLSKKRGFQAQPPYTTPVALNVLPEKQEDDRESGGSRPGLGKALTNQIGDGSPFNMLGSVTYVDTSGVLQHALVAASNGLLYRRRSGTTWTQVTSNLTIASDTLIQASEHLQKLYIADYSTTPLLGTDGTTNASPGTTFDSATYTDWVASGVDADDYVVVVRSGGTGTQGVYAISSVATGSLTLSSSPGASLTGIHFSVERSPKLYDPSADTLTRWTADADAGQVPVGNPAIATWRDRVVLAGSHEAPHLWYLSRGGNAGNWHYGANDALQAVSGTSADAGPVIHNPIRALVPHHADCLMLGCTDSLWAMRGDPADGGAIDNLSYTIGIIDRLAWCKTAEKLTIFMSKDGLYRVTDPCGSVPERISREVLPDDFLFTNTDHVRTILAYDKLLGKVLISRTVF